VRAAALTNYPAPVYKGPKFEEEKMNFLVCTMLCSIIGLPLFAFAQETKKIVGVAERVCLEPEGLLLAAKMDTGADNSSLNVGQLTSFSRNGQEWVRFQVMNEEGHTTTFERKLIRTAQIKRHAGTRHERPVVLMGIRLGDSFREAEVNLVDRSRFKYQLLIGRSFMAGLVVVDPSAQFTVEPVCRGAEE
jgi:hypothetical protein